MRKETIACQTAEIARKKTGKCGRGSVGKSVELRKERN